MTCSAGPRRRDDRSCKAEAACPADAGEGEEDRRCYSSPCCEATSAVTNVGSTTNVGSSTDVGSYWRHHDGHWNYWHDGDQRWYYNDGAHWFYHDGNAWNVYGFDRQFGRAGVERGNYRAPEAGAKIQTPKHSAPGKTGKK